MTVGVDDTHDCCLLSVKLFYRLSVSEIGGTAQQRSDKSVRIHST
jgi:hypothetical protein